MSAINYCLLILLHMLLLSLTITTIQSTNSTGSIDSSSNINLTVYYESLCPDCQRFIGQQLVPTYQSIGQIINVDLVTFGWTNWTRINRSDGSYDVEFKCQHGVQECLGNEIHNCVLKWEPVDRAIQMFGCMFNSTYFKTPAIAGKECSQHLGINWTVINDCSTGPLGRGLTLVSGNRFKSLKPMPKFVEWLVINGRHTDDMEKKASNNLLKYLCDIYTGPKPSGCYT
ncbi:gamma-interferon-inducible lysosomal thiol reductase-like [Oppia nitens]|uniref:gamma-interferon-inducible lysosomal thiol reductase-like n=1 Tax=Oppia nitens TaxID=1686743 RepID=UPI0023DA8217|nr:gamma-interferon-inducible lysosomal thiol reductase-like [Oppia nitens]